MTGPVQPTPEEVALVESAREVRPRAWCPYSRFPVGAAVRTADGTIHTGVNVENASFGLTLCAERVAIVQAITAGHTKIEAVAVVTEKGAAPCGACRQVLREFAAPRACRVLIATPDGIARVVSLAELLPLSFGPDDLR